MPRSGVRNPSFGCRVALVAAVYAVLAALGGGLLAPFAPVPLNPMAWPAAGGFGAFVGGLLEAVYG